MDVIPTNLSVAIVDDECSVRRSLGRLMRSAGIQLEVFASGAEFLERLPTGSWQVVLLDIHIPGLTGFELLKRARDERPELAVVMITGYEEREVKRRAYEAGAKGFLLKPFMFSEFLEVVRALPGVGTQAHQ